MISTVYLSRLLTSKEAILLSRLYLMDGLNTMTIQSTRLELIFIFEIMYHKDTAEGDRFGRSRRYFYNIQTCKSTLERVNCISLPFWGDCMLSMTGEPSIVIVFRPVVLASKQAASIPSIWCPFLSISPHKEIRPVSLRIPAGFLYQVNYSS